MKWFRASIPDKGAGNSGVSIFVEAESESSARKRIRNCSRYSMYDSEKGQLAEVGSFSLVQNQIMNTTGPNEAINCLGTVLIRNLEEGEIKKIKGY